MHQVGKRRLAKYLRKYIKDFNPDQVSSRLLSGEIELRDLELEVAPLNEALAGALPYTLELQAASCSSVRVEVPWTALRGRPVCVSVGSCRARVQVHGQDDPEWARTAALRSREALAEATAKTEGRAEKVDGEEHARRTNRLSDTRIVITDGLVVTLESLELVVVSAKPTHRPGGSEGLGSASPLSEPPTQPAPLPVWEILACDLAFGPRACPGSRISRRPGAAREQTPTWTTVRRQLTIGSVEVRSMPNRASSSTPPCHQESASVSTSGVVVELLEWHDVGHLLGSGSPSISEFPREVRADVHVPSAEVRCSQAQLAALAALGLDAAAPPQVPVEALPPDAVHLHGGHPSLAEAVEEARARRAAKKRSMWATQATGTASLSPEQLKESASAMAQRAAVSAMSTAKRSGVMATQGASAAKVMAAQGVTRAATAATGARASASAAATRAAAGAAVARQKVSLGGTMAARAAAAARQAAERKASVLRGSKSAGPQPCHPFLDDDAALQAALALSAEEADAAAAAEEIAAEDERSEHGDGAAPASREGGQCSSGSSDEQDAWAEALASRMGGEDDAASTVGDDAAADDFGRRGRPLEPAARLSTHAGTGPSPMTRRAAVHLCIASAKVELAVPVGGSSASLLLCARALDASLEGTRRLTAPEARCLESLGLASPRDVKDCEDCSRAPFGTSGSAGVWITLGSADLSFAGGEDLEGGTDEAGGPSGRRAPDPRPVFWTETGGSTAWLLTARASSRAGLDGKPVLRACVHGARAAPRLEVVRALESLVRALRALPPARDDGSDPVKHSSGQAMQWPAGLPKLVPTICVTCRNTVLDLGPVSPLEPLRVLLPAAFASVLDPADGGEPEAPEGLDVASVPLWHAPAPQARDAVPAPDFHLYSCTCGSIGPGAEAPAGAAAGQVVAEQQWRATAAAGLPEVVLPAEELAALSRARAEALGQEARWAELSQARPPGARAAFVGREAARRIPMVRELLDEAGGAASCGPLRAQLEALRAEVADLQEEWPEHEERLRVCERETASMVAKVRAGHAARDLELRRQLDSERAVTQALSELVGWQEAAIAKLLAAREARGEARGGPGPT
ncbi:unnamed protein product [Prorocentrum cordatum]|uniref:Chorein N-terminal domain-containing protein n=1 Tax=Prorocentrum cordatum TaxID=2364126 RepID=A0ABN9YGN4_9DINO|nr:unnamed protein product [Polarella glacialis]